jgi:hypothetical protein
MIILTATGEEDLKGRVLQKIPTCEDGTYFREVPLAMQMITVLQHLQHGTLKTFEAMASEKVCIHLLMQRDVDIVYYTNIVNMIWLIKIFKMCII